MRLRFVLLFLLVDGFFPVAAHGRVSCFQSAATTAAMLCNRFLVCTEGILQLYLACLRVPVYSRNSRRMSRKLPYMPTQKAGLGVIP